VPHAPPGIVADFLGRATDFCRWRWHGALPNRLAVTMMTMGSPAANKSGKYVL
jgi:hypothetical protein